MSPRIEIIKRAVEKAAGCAAEHLDSVPVIEMFREQVMWQGMVEVFALGGHPRANKAYGWQFNDKGIDKCTAVLEIPPVNSPNTAVRAAIAAQHHS
jgi:hypothetical protein